MTVAATHNRRILVIDDNESIHEDFCRILQSSGTVSSEIDKVEAELFGNTEAPGPPRDSFELDFALQGQNGYERVLQAVNAGRPYALAFVDVRMPPGWDGIETIERLWDIDPDLQIAVCTAYADYSWDEIIARLGRTDKLLLLKKPFDKAEVWQLACSLTEKWRLARQADQKLGELGKAIENRTAELEVEVFERRRIEEALRESEERYRNVYETAPLAFVLWDRECRLIGWNDRAPPSPEVAERWPPVMWLMRAPCAVVGGGGARTSPLCWAAANRPAIRPDAALST